nr:hypothetical protein HmN_000994300 [Hymenolepis microstoma]
MTLPPMIVVVLISNSRQKKREKSRPSTSLLMATVSRGGEWEPGEQSLICVFVSASTLYACYIYWISGVLEEQENPKSCKTGGLRGGRG